MKVASSDPLLDVFNEISGDLKVDTMSIGNVNWKNGASYGS
jgi:hypothetical protein